MKRTATVLSAVLGLAVMAACESSPQNDGVSRFAQTNDLPPSRDMPAPPLPERPDPGPDLQL